MATVNSNEPETISAEEAAKALSNGSGQIVQDNDIPGTISMADAQKALNQGLAEIVPNENTGLSAPKEPQATTLLSDKNIVIGHPMDMSHDQVNDAIQTQVYGRPRNDFHLDATPLAPHVVQAFKDTVGIPLALGPTFSNETMKETAKGAVRGIENIGVGIAGLAKWFGEGVQHEGTPTVPEEPAWLKSIGSKTAEVAQNAINWIHEREQKGLEAPDPEVFRGSFVSNPSVSRIAAQVAEGIPTLGAAAAVSIATGNPAAGLGAIGLLSAGQEYEQNREAGASTGTASEAAAASGIGNTLLMSLPMGKLLSGEGAGVAKTALEFASINTPMVAMNNLIARIGVDKARPLFEGWLESTISMAATGGIMGATMPGKGLEIDSQVQDLHKAGISAREIDAARAEVGEQLVKNPKIVSDSIDQARKQLEPTGQNLQPQAGSQSAYQASPDAIFPAIEASSDKSISENPAFQLLRNDAASVVNKYAAERQVPATTELATNLFREMHDALGELMRAPADKKAEVKAALEEKYPDMENEFMALHNMGYIEKDKVFAKTMLKDYGIRRPVAGIEYEKRIRPNEYVKNEPFNLRIGKNDAETSKNIIEEHQGIANSQIVRGNQFAESIERSIPEKQREAITWYNEAKGDKEVLLNWLDDPKLDDYHAQISEALALSPEAIRQAEKVKRYFEESGEVSKENDVIKNLRENYQNRIYEPRPPSDYIKTEVNKGLKQTTEHANLRVFETMADAAAYRSEQYPEGLKFATTDIAKLIRIHNEEMANVNASRKMFDAMSDNGLIGAWSKTVPDGWSAVGKMQKSAAVLDKNGEPVIDENGEPVRSFKNFIAPKGIAEGLEMATDPDYIKKIDSFRRLHQYQGLVKTINLGLFSYFHHWNFIKNTVSAGGISNLLRVIHSGDYIHSDFNKFWEQDFVRNLGTTSSLGDNIDILRSLTKDNHDFFSKITNLPVVKKLLERTEKNSEFLFGKVQRFLQVSEYARKVSNWIAKNSNATDEELTDAKKGFAKFTNDQYGGQNWKAMGMTKTNLSLLRLLMLAPDWFYSNNNMIKNFFVPESKTRGSASRKFMITGVLGGIVLTEGLNKMMTGHFTDENKKGHGLDVEFSPDVYVNFFPAPVAESLKMWSMMREDGIGPGSSRYLMGKSSPLVRAGLVYATRRTYSGREITSTADMLKEIALSMTPLPITLGNLYDYMKEEPNKTVRGGLAIATGLGRYSKSKSSTSKINY